MFFIDTLEAASQEAFYGKAREVSGLPTFHTVLCGRIVGVWVCDVLKEEKKTLHQMLSVTAELYI